jgi:hypothetical protein
VLPNPPVSAAPTASLRCPMPQSAVDDWGPVARRPTCQPRRPASRRPRRSKLSRGNAPPASAAVGPQRHRRHATPLRYSTPRQVPLSPVLPPHGAHPSGAPPRRFPLKRSRRRPNFLPLPTIFPSLLRRRATATSLTSTSSRRTALPLTRALSSPTLRPPHVEPPLG